MADDFLTKVQQYQLNANLNSDNITGMPGVNMGVDLQNTDVWTQAQMLENKYKSQIQIAAQMNPLETSKVMNNFMNEALDLLFSSLNTPVASGSDTSLNLSSQNISSFSDEIEHKNIDEGESYVAQEQQKAQEEAKEEAIKEKKEEYKEKIETDVISGKTDTIEEAMNDDSLSIKDKKELVEIYTKEKENLGKKDDGKAQVALISNVQKSLNDDELSATDAIKYLKEMKNGTRSLKKGDQIGGYKYKDAASFAVALYIQAQKEGKLAEALEVVPPTPAIQKSLSFNKETKTIITLIETLEQNVQDKTSGKYNSYGISDDRAKELRQDASKMIDTVKYANGGVSSDYAGFSAHLMHELFDEESKKYNNNEKMYLFELVIDSLKSAYREAGGKSYQKHMDQRSSVDFFVSEFFRNMSAARQEKYFPELLNLYAKFDE